MTDNAGSSSSRESWRLVGRRLKLIGRTLREAHETLSLYEQPDWARTPDKISGVPPDLAPEELNRFDDDLNAGQLRPGRDTIARVIAEIRDQSVEGELEEVRPVDCWLSLEGDDVVAVHIGTSQIAQVTGPIVPPIRAAVQAWGRGVNAIRADSNLYGATPESAHINYLGRYAQHHRVTSHAALSDEGSRHSAIKIDVSWWSAPD